MNTSARCVAALILLLPALAAVSDAAPEVAFVYPEYGMQREAPNLLLGEGLDGAGLEIWTWAPGEAGEAPPAAPPALPATPPEGAKRVRATHVLDAAAQVAVARLPADAAALWVKTEAGWSSPYLLGVARPFWLDDEAYAPGAVARLFGFRLRPRADACRVALRSADGTVLHCRLSEDLRSPRTADEKLVLFDLPDDAAPGAWEVFVHNGTGGAFGWVRAGALEIAAPPPAPPVLNVRDFGAAGDGIADDRGALERALAAAAEQAPAVLALPPGTYLTGATLVVPAGVTLRGGGRDNTILRGTGAGAGRVRAIVSLGSRSGLERLGVEGAAGEGEPYGLVRIPDREGKHPERVAILECRLRALEVDPATGGGGHPVAVALATARHVRFVENEIHGAIRFGHVERFDVVGNTFFGGSTGVTTLHGWVYDSLLDDNTFTDMPGRICWYPRRHSYLRYNEVRGAHKGTWANAEEVFLFHGGGGASWGTVTGAEASTLTRAEAGWTADARKGQVVLVLDGRGFGQYRVVTGNTADTLSLDRPWRIVPDATSEFVVMPAFLESAMFANVNDTPLRTSLWLNCVGNEVVKHRDVFAKGIDIWGQDRTAAKKRPGYGPDRLLPSYYNMLRGGWHDGAMIHLYAGTPKGTLAKGPPLFGTYVVGNRMKASHLARHGSFSRLEDNAIQVGNHDSNYAPHQPGRAACAYSVVAGNEIAFTPAGVEVTANAWKTFVLDNRFVGVDEPVRDGGRETLVSD